MKLSTVELFKNLKSSSKQLIHVEGETLLKYQKVLIGISEDIIEVCEEENIPYYLLGGSALGAVRHKGFIPWDDDMDMGILGDDFESFVAAFKNKHSDKYWVHTYNTPDYGILTNRIRLKNSICRAREDVNNEECGFYVDIFRIENTFNNRILYNIHGALCMGMGLLLSCRNFYKNRDLMLELSKDNKKVRRVFNIKICIGKFLSICSLQWWAVNTQRCYALCKNSSSKYVTIPAGRKHYFGETLLRTVFGKPVDCDFEGHRWKIPQNAHAYLSNLYGDYMKIPTVEDRESHVLLELSFPEHCEGNEQ